MTYTVVRPALWICGGKHCSFHITSLLSDCEDWITCSRQFFTETEGNYIHTSEFYPQSLREKTLCTLVCPQCPQITTVWLMQSTDSFSFQLEFNMIFWFLFWISINRHLTIYSTHSFKPQDSILGFHPVLFVPYWTESQQTCWFGFRRCFQLPSSKHLLGWKIWIWFLLQINLDAKGNQHQYCYHVQQCKGCFC